MATDQMHTAIHEAGHAVIGRRLGMVCGHVTIAADHESAGHSVTAHPGQIDAMWERRGKFRLMASVLRGRIITLMAGAEAEIECLGRSHGGEGSLYGGYGSDRAEIEAMLCARDYDRDDADLSEHEAALRRHTRGLVRRHRRAIERLAAVLLDQTTLSAAEADMITGAVTPISIPWEPRPWMWED